MRQSRVFEVGLRSYPAWVDEPLVISADRYKYWQVDFQNGIIKIVCQDGQIEEEVLEPKISNTGLVNRHFHLRLGEVVDPVGYH